MWVEITYPFPNFIILSHTLLGMWLLIHVGINFSKRDHRCLDYWVIYMLISMLVNIIFQTWLPVQQQRHTTCIRNHFNNINLPITSKIAVSNHVHPSGIRHPKHHWYINQVLQYIICFKNDWSWLEFVTSAEGYISQCLLDAVYNPIHMTCTDSSYNSHNIVTFAIVWQNKMHLNVFYR